MIPTREQLEAWAEECAAHDIGNPYRPGAGGSPCAAFLRSDALREALSAVEEARLWRGAAEQAELRGPHQRDRAEAWKALAMDAPRLCYRVLDDGADMETEWYTRINALLAQEKEGE